MSEIGIEFIGTRLLLVQCPVRVPPRMGTDDTLCGERPLNRVVLHLNPLLSQLLGSPTVYEDEVLNVLTEKGLITAVSHEKGPGGEGGKKVGVVAGGGGGDGRMPRMSSSAALAPSRLPRKSSVGAALAGAGKELGPRPSFKRVARSFVSVARGLGKLSTRDEEPEGPSSPPTSSPVLTASDRWRLAVKHTKEMAKLHSFDPWWDRNLHQLRSEVCVRYDYDPETREWVGGAQLLTILTTEQKEVCAL